MKKDDVSFLVPGRVVAVNDGFLGEISARDENFELCHILPGEICTILQFDPVRYNDNCFFCKFLSHGKIFQCFIDRTTFREI